MYATGYPHPSNRALALDVTHPHHDVCDGIAPPQLQQPALPDLNPSVQIVQTDMESDLAQQVEACCAGVRKAIAPLEAAAALEEESVAEFQRECGRLGEAVEEVLARVARLHIAAD